MSSVPKFYDIYWRITSERNTNGAEIYRKRIVTLLRIQDSGTKMYRNVRKIFHLGTNVLREINCQESQI